MQPFRRKNNRRCITGFTRSLIAFWVVFFVITGLVYSPLSNLSNIPQAHAGITIPSGVIIAWPSTAASIPSGWSRVTALDTIYVRGVPNTATDPGTTGGATTHTHTTSAHDHTISHTHATATSGNATGSVTAGTASNTDLQSTTHTHTTGTVAATTDNSGTAAPSSSATSNDPAYLKVIWIQSDGSPTGIPNGALAMFNSASLPASWAIYTNSQDKFLKGADASGDGGATGGAATHNHTGEGSHTHISDHVHPNGTTAASAGTNNSYAAGSTAAGDVHTHTYTVSSSNFGTSNAATLNTSTDNHEPPWQKLAVIENQTGGVDAPIGTIAIWRGTLASIPAGWVVADGNNGTPNLLGDFVKGVANTGEIGNTGGATSHTHTGSNHTHTWASTAHTHPVNFISPPSVIRGTAGSTATWANPTHTHTATSGAASAITPGNAAPNLDSATHLPAYEEVAYIMLKSTTLTTGTNPGNSTIAPGASATQVNSFILTTDTGTDAITAITVSLPVTTGIGTIAIHSNSSCTASLGSVGGGTGSGITSSTNVSISSTNAITSGTTFYVCATPLSHANMAAPDGGAYGITGNATDWTGSNGQGGKTADTSSTITIDNDSPAATTGASATPGDTTVDVGWTAPGDGDFQQVYIYCKTSSMISGEAPAEGTDPSVDGAACDGTARLKYKGTTSPQTITGLTNSTLYYFRIYARDTNGNFTAYASTQEVSATPAATSFRVQGNAYEDEATTALTICDGSGAMIAVSVNGAVAVTGSCADANGSFDIDTGGAAPAAGAPIHVWVDGTTACNANNANSCGTTIIRYSGSGNITNAIVRRNRLVIRDDDGTAVTNININVRDHADDNDIVYTVDASNNIVVEDNIKVMVPSGDSWTPGATVTTDPSASAAAVDGDISVAGTMTVAANAVSVGGDFAATGTYSYTAGSQTTTFAATATGHTIDDGTNNFDSVIFSGSSGGWSFSNAVILGGALTMTAGTLSGTADLTVTTDVIGTAGLITLTGGTFEQRIGNASRDFGPTTANTDWTFNNLTFTRFADTLTITKQSCATCDVTITDTLLVSKTADGPGITLNAGDATWTLSNANSAAPFDDDQGPGTLIAASSTFVYSGDNDGGDVTIENATFNNLTLGGGVVENYTPANPITVSGNLVLNSNATLIGTHNVSVNGGGVTGDGAVNLTGGIFKVDGAGSFGGATAWTFNNLQFGDGTGSTTTTASGGGAINVSNIMTVKANQTLSAGARTWNLNGAPTGGVIDFVQDGSNGTASGTSTAVTLNVTSGNLLVAIVTTDQDITPTVSDTQGNTYQLDFLGQNFDTRERSVYSTIAGSTGSNTITLSHGSAQRLGLIVKEFSGVATASRVDQAVDVTGGPGTAASSGNITTTVASDLLVGFVGASGTPGASLGVGYANVEENANGRLAGEDKVVVGTVTDDADFTITSQTWVAGVVSYKPIASTSPFVVETGGTFTASSSTVVYKGNGDITVANVNYNDLTFSPLQTVSGKSYNIGTGAFAVGGNWNINPDAASGLNLSVILNGATTVTGTLTIQRTNSATSSLSTNGSHHALNAAAINIATGGSLTANNSTVTLTGTGNAFTAAGTFNIGNSTVVYNHTTSANIENTTYYHLSLTPASGNPTYTPDVGTIRVDGNMVIGGGTTMVFNMNTNDPLLDLRGNLTLANNATFTKSANTTTTVQFRKGAAGQVYTNSGTIQDIGAVQISVNGGDTTLAPATAMTVSYLAIDDSQTFSSANTLQLTGAGTGSSRPLRIGSGSTFSATGAVIYDIAGTAEVENTTYPNNLTLRSTAGTGTLILGTASSQTINVTGRLQMSGTGNVIIDAATYSPAINVDWHINLYSGTTFTKGSGTLTIKNQGGSTSIQDDNATKQDLGIVRISELNPGSPTTIDMASDIKLTSLEIDNGETWPVAASTTLTFTSNGAALVNNGTFDASAGTVAFVPASTGTITFPAQSYNNLTFNGSGSTFRPPSGTLNIGGTLTVTAGTFDLNTNDPTTSVTGNITNAGTFDASSANPLTFSGNFTNNGTFNANGGTVIATPSGATTTIDGSTATTNFYSLTMNQATKALKFKATNTYGFAGTLTLNGTQAQFMDLSSDTASSQWLINLSGTASITYLRIKDSGCNGGSLSVTVGESSVNNGNNGTCWSLVSRGAGTPGAGDTSGGGSGQTGGGAGGAADITTNLVGHWKFDEASGTTTVDSSGNGNTGTLTGGPTWTAGKVNSVGISFDGSDDYVGAGSAASLDNIQSQGGGGMTVAFWVNVASNTTKPLVAKSGANGTWKINKSSATSPARLAFYKDSTGANDLNVSWNSVLPTNTWIHVVVTWDGTVVQGGANAYINGVLEGRDFSTDGTDIISDGDNNLTIGGDNSGSGSSDASMDDVRIYSRVLSSTDIAELYKYRDDGGSGGGTGQTGGGAAPPGGGAP